MSLSAIRPTVPQPVPSDALRLQFQSRRKWTGPGGPPGLQNRSLPAHAGGLGSTPRRFRHLV